jgi:hypothetical protein
MVEGSNLEMAAYNCLEMKQHGIGHVGKQFKERKFLIFASGGSTVVQLLPHHPKVKGSSPTAVGNGREDGEK